MKVIAYLHTHWDREWYRTFEEFRIRFVEVFDDIVEKLQREEFSQFYLDGQTVLIEDLLELYPEKKKLIKDLVAKKKLVVGPWYTLADEFLVSGESLIRNLLIGMKDSLGLGVKDFTGYLPDAFGHTQAMPQILKSFGINNAILWRGAGDKPSEFIWKSKDGSEVLCTHLIEGYFQDYLSSSNLEGVISFLDKIKEKNLGDLILLPIGADHLGVEDNLPEKIFKLNKKSDYDIEVGSVFDYLKVAAGKNLSLPVIAGELRDNSRNFILPGTYSTRNYLKRQNTLLTWELKKVEAFLSLCQHYDLLSSKQAEIDYVWRTLLKNHAHDSICGCSVDEVHQEMEIRNKKISQLLDTLKQRVIFTIEDDGENSEELFVFNSSSFTYSGLVEFQTTKKLSDKDGFLLVKKDFGFPQAVLQDIHKVPIAEDMKEIYTYKVFVDDVKPLNFGSVKITVPNDLKVDANTIENEFLKVEVQKDGSLIVLDKTKNIEHRGLHVIEDKSDLGDSYNFSPCLDNKVDIASFVGAKIIEQNSLEVVLELEYALRSESIKTLVILEAQSPLLKFKTVWENKGENHLLQIKFKMQDSIVETISEDALGTVKRIFDPDYDLMKQQSAEGFCELKTNTAPMQRFVWAQGAGVLTKGLHEYEVSGNELKITLLRSVGMLSKTNLHTRSIYAGPPIELPEAQCKRECIAEYAVSFCDEENMFELADKYFNPTIACLSSLRKDRIFFDNSNIYLMAVKESQKNKGIILRCLNLSSETQTLKFEAIEVNLVEEQMSHPYLCCECSVAPFALKSLRLV